MYKKEQVYEEALAIIADKKLSKISEIFKLSKFSKNVFYKYKYNKDPVILEALSKNRIKRKKDLIKEKSSEIEEIKARALQILTKEIEDPKSGLSHRVNAMIYRIDFLCVKLHISTATFYDYNLHQDKEIREELDNNRESLKIGTYTKLYNSKSPIGNLSFLKLIGNEEERKRIATTYQEIKQETEEVKVSLADELRELLINVKSKNRDTKGS
jgi:hypothetical protein